MLNSTSFIFDGIPSEDYGVMIYFLNDDDKRELDLGTDVDIIEDRLSTRTAPIHYGVDVNRPMKFPLTFGSIEYLEDYDVDAILSWLTGHQQYKWLEYVDGDHYVRYKCILNDVKSVYINGLPVAFTCDVVCDGQFAYEYPTTFTYDIDNMEYPLEFYNKSSYNGYIYPKMELAFEDDCNSFSIINDSDNGREFKINYFDREITNSSNSEIIYNTTISKESSSSIVDSNFLSWSMTTLPTANNYGEIIKGKDTMILLPIDSNVAMYSDDNGSTWKETILPYSGSWTGCYGENGFVAICTDPNTAIATYSNDGRVWNSVVIDMPVPQDWKKVIYVETKGFSPNQYLAIGGEDSNIAAISLSGWAWELVSLPQNGTWKSAFSRPEQAFIIGDNTNVALMSNDCIHWEEILLPRVAAWRDGCYGVNGFVIICDSLYGSGEREGIALTSTDGEIWNVIDFPIGSWNSIEYNAKGYVAIGEKQFIHSIDTIEWKSNMLPLSGMKIFNINDEFNITLGNNNILTSTANSTIKGTFDVAIPGDPNITITDVYINGLIENTVNDTTYSSNNKKLLASCIYSEDPNVESNPVITGGSLVALTTDLRYGVGIDGVMVSAEYNQETQTATVNYVADLNHTSVINAPMTISITYQANSVVDLGYNNLVANIDNNNQIITTNKPNLNLYEYFNKKFFRLKKGINKLRIKTEQGKCKLTITCEFLKKAGGR